LPPKHFCGCTLPPPRPLPNTPTHPPTSALTPNSPNPNLSHSPAGGGPLSPPALLPGVPSAATLSTPAPPPTPPLRPAAHHASSAGHRSRPATARGGADPAEAARERRGRALPASPHRPHRVHRVQAAQRAPLVGGGPSRAFPHGDPAWARANRVRRAAVSTSVPRRRLRAPYAASAPRIPAATSSLPWRARAPLRRRPRASRGGDLAPSALGTTSTASWPHRCSRRNLSPLGDGRRTPTRTWLGLSFVSRRLHHQGVLQLLLPSAHPLVAGG
jgi:hypothetical protein